MTLDKARHIGIQTHNLIKLEGNSWFCSLSRIEEKLTEKEKNENFPFFRYIQTVSEERYRHWTCEVLKTPHSFTTDPSLGHCII